MKRILILGFVILLLLGCTTQSSNPNNPVLPNQPNGNTPQNSTGPSPPVQPIEPVIANQGMLKIDTDGITHEYDNAKLNLVSVQGKPAIQIKQTTTDLNFLLLVRELKNNYIGTYKVKSNWYEMAVIFNADNVSYVSHKDGQDSDFTVVIKEFPSSGYATGYFYGTLFKEKDSASGPIQHHVEGSFNLERFPDE